MGFENSPLGKGLRRERFSSYKLLYRVDVARSAVGLSEPCPDFADNRCSARQLGKLEKLRQIYQVVCKIQIRYRNYSI